MIDDKTCDSLLDMICTMQLGGQSWAAALLGDACVRVIDFVLYTGMKSLLWLLESSGCLLKFFMSALFQEGLSYDRHYEGLEVVFM